MGRQGVRKERRLIINQLKYKKMAKKFSEKEVKMMRRDSLINGALLIIALAVVATCILFFYQP